MSIEMTIERTMVCDNCGGVIAAASTVALVRKEAWEQCGAKRIKNRDYCAECLSRARALSEAARKSE